MIDAEREQQEENIKEHLHQTYEQLKQLTQQINDINESWNQSAESFLDRKTLQKLSTLEQIESSTHVTYSTAQQEFLIDKDTLDSGGSPFDQSITAEDKHPQKEVETNYS